MIKIRYLSKRLGSFSLDEINIEVNKEEYFVILGPTGAGKSTLLEIIAGVNKPDQGEIWINGREVSGWPPEARNIGLVFQDGALFPHLRVIDNIKYGLRLKKHGVKEIKEKIENILKLLHISQIKDAYPMTLSGGERQRVALARTLVLEPKVLLLDEPLSSLHPDLKKRLQDELRKVQQELKMTTIQVTHDHDLVLPLADRLAIMNNGKIIQVGRPEEIFQRPQSEFVANFVRCKI
ncbi:ABC transporter ATP-binding protein [bacterium]|nr:ABC transporter ATP-binding protein [bacterium]MBU0900151.1 ABC transporter ATP-binding protein [bacterium]MBU1153692.1 ABC transporter ATP-binding protein [bacterium]MBU1782370.1 ABC transporter ATP-binding protein [bacterium]MBU2599956.1 ABC transporter ATP-binding protein [bacterium]